MNADEIQWEDVRHGEPVRMPVGEKNMDPSLTLGIARILAGAVDQDGIVDDFAVAELADNSLVTTKDFIMISATSKLVEDALELGICGQLERRFLLEIGLRMPREFKHFVIEHRTPNKVKPAVRPSIQAQPTAWPEVVSTRIETLSPPEPLPKEPTTIDVLRNWAQAELPSAVELPLQGGGSVQAVRQLKQEGRPSDINGGGGEFLIVSYLVGRAPQQETVATLSFDPTQGVPDRNVSRKDIADQIEDRIEQSDRQASGVIRKVMPTRPRGTNTVCIKHNVPTSQCHCAAPSGMATTVQSGIMRRPGA